MDLKSAIKRILEDLKDADDLINDLKNKPDLPVLHIELARSKCKSAADLLELIGDIIEDSNTEKIEKKQEIQEPVAEKQSEPETVQQEEISQDKEEIIAEEIPQENDTLYEDDTNEEKDLGVKDKEHDNKPDSKADKIVADKFSHLSDRINEKVGDKKKAGSKSRTVIITDLYKALGLNDRFYFIRELFKGDESAFKQTINRLNDANSREEAENILQEELEGLSASAPALELLELVERKISIK